MECGHHPPELHPFFSLHRMRDKEQPGDEEAGDRTKE